jgi:hypothetical protein
MHYKNITLFSRSRSRVKLFIYLSPEPGDIVEEDEVGVPQALRLHHAQVEQQRGGGSVHQLCSIIRTY